METKKDGKSPVNKEEAQKILATVTYDRGFHFFNGIGKFTGETAIGLFSFYEELRTIELQSVKFHFHRRDFQNWIETTLNDQELASRIDKMPSGLTDEELKKELMRIVQARLTELQTASNSAGEQTTPRSGANVSGQELRRLTADELKEYDGQQGKPAYFAFEGKVYDVSSSNLWEGGLHMAAHEAGKDLTEAINSAPHGEEVMNKAKQVGVLS